MGVEAKSWFYQLNGLSATNALGPLLERCLDRGWRVLLLAKPERLAALEQGLWVWREDSFVAHGLASDPLAEAQPVLLSSVAEPVNGAQVLVLLDGIEADSTGFERCMVLFDDDGGDALKTARAHYKWALQNGGARFFRRTPKGWSEHNTANSSET